MLKHKEMNKALFFPLFVNDFDEVQLTTLKRKFGIEGYGIYTFLRTKLQDVDNYEYPVSMIPDLAYMAGVPESKMKDVIYNSNLFLVGNDYFSCPLLDEALNRHNGIIEKKSGQGKKGGKVRMSSMTPEELSKFGKEAAAKRWNKNQPTVTLEVNNSMPANASNAGNAGINAGIAGINIPANAGIMPSNDIDMEMEIESEKEMEREKETEKESEIEKDIESKPEPSSSLVSSSSNQVSSSSNQVLTSSSQVDNSNSSSQYLTLEQMDSIEKEIKEVEISEYFNRDNFIDLVEMYIDYRKQYPNTKLDLMKFEKLVVFTLYQHLLNNNLGDTYTLNESFVKFHFNPTHFQDMLNYINSQPEIRKKYVCVVNGSKLPVPTQLKFDV